jgi:hypothetical protein
MAEAALSEGAPASGGGCELVVHVEAGTLASDDPGRCRLENGSAIAPETARRLACDGSIVPLVEADGSTISVGRKTRRIPPALARALRARDGTCRFPGCENRRFGDAHHIVHWAKGGETSLDNLVWLCRRHHRLVHEGGFSVERRSDGEVAFSDAWGEPLREASALPPGRIDGLIEGADQLACGTGERLDLGYAVSVLADGGLAVSRE